MKKINKIFTYGTLLTGMVNAYILEKDTIKSNLKATIAGELFMVKGASYPALLLDNKDTLVKGEVYEIKDEFLDEVIALCDHLEGHPSYYKRKIEKVTLADGTECEAYVYEFMIYQYLGEKIENGDYKSYYKTYLKN